MIALLQLFGAVAIALGLLGTWLAGQRRAGWLVCIVSTVLWLPTLVSGEQWAAVVNCGLSVAICVRNFRAGGAAARSTDPAAAEVRPARPARPARRVDSAEGVGFEPTRQAWGPA
jgi:hypothetical protein